jgi:hypothetical protein
MTAIYRLTAALCFSVLLLRCVDPVEPAYDYETGFFLVEGSIADRAGASEVRISRSVLEFDIYRLEPVNDADVVSVDDTGNAVRWSRINREGAYRPPEDFAGRGGISYHLEIATRDGNLIESNPERMPAPAGFSNLRYRFDQESYFSAGRERFIPAFTFLLDLDDPADTKDYYQFRYRTWQFTTICETCYQSVYRNGVCVQTPASRGVDFYDYSCDGPCWFIEDGEGFRLLTDELNPGGDFQALPVGRLDYTGTGGILVEMTQRRLTASAFAYYKVFNDLNESAGGLNAPLPAPLYGNLTDRSDAAINVLGYVAATAVSSDRLYWNRGSVDGTPLSIPRAPVFEPLVPSPPSAPCSGPNRTNQRPAGWPQ